MCRLEKSKRIIGLLVICSILYHAWVFADSTGASGTPAGWDIGWYSVRSSDGIGGSYGGYFLAFYWGGCAMGNPFTGGSCACPSGYAAGWSGQNADQFGDHFLEYQCYKY